MSAWHPSIKSPPVAPDVGGVVRGKRREKRKPKMDKLWEGEKTKVSKRRGEVVSVSWRDPQEPERVIA